MPSLVGSEMCIRDSLSDSQIEEKARDLGMIYESESKSILRGED